MPLENSEDAQEFIRINELELCETLPYLSQSHCQLVSLLYSKVLSAEEPVRRARVSRQPRTSALKTWLFQDFE